MNIIQLIEMKLRQEPLFIDMSGMWYLATVSLCSRSVSQTISSLRHSKRVVCFNRHRQLSGTAQQQQQRQHLTTNQLILQTIHKKMSTTAAQIDNNIRICIIEPKDRQRVLDFLRIHYYCEEPLTVGTTPKQQDKADEDFNMSNIDHGTCLMAIQRESETIVGAVLAGPKGPDEADHLLEDAAKEGPTKWGTILKFLAGVERAANVCSRYGVEKVLHAHVIGVDRKMRGHNIGGSLMNELKVLARKLNYELLTADCTSYYSGKMCERLGWECVNVVYYKDCVDDNGRPIITSNPPHDCCRTYAVKP
ncbi:arylalkylamine N-acetyltransferase-like 2 [Haematobia irritans]|uniref:arylalkylamine N-acetyltransferase-like 2 n=1 Tax=Haematobia irritans TaxID=7368 RepID=UPI003F506048